MHADKQLITTDVRPCLCCPHQTGHPANHCPLRPLSTAVRHSPTTVTTRPGRGSTTTSAPVIPVGGNHVWHYSGSSATVAIQIPTAVIETPTVAIQMRDKQKRRRRKRPNKVAKRARKAYRTNTTAAAATADLPAPATNKRRLCHNCGKSHTGASSPLRRTCGRRHLAGKPCRTGTRRRPAPRQLPTVVNNYTFNGDGHAITISAHPSSAGAVPPPAKRQKRRKRPNKAKEKVEEKKEEEREKDAEPAEEVEKPSTELCLNEYPPRRPKTTKNNEAG
ncbi:hypothetical protein IFM5058_10627 [Aspergillus udagawae]|nr:hypothetical protein IFM5058_10627 [Aspergillus udagawae]